MRQALILPFLVLASLIFIPVATTQAVDPFERGVCDNPRTQDAAVCKDKDLPEDSSGKTQNPIFGPKGVLTVAIQILSAIVGIAAVIMIILAGLKYITSGNNPQEVNNARERIIYACIALAIAAIAQSIVIFVLSKL